MRLIDADALKEKKVYSHERHEKIVPVAEIDWLPAVDAIPVEWLEKQADFARSEWDYDTCDAIHIVLKAWQKEQEAKDGK